MNEKVFRNSLVELLKGGSAHVSVKDALAGIEPDDARTKPDQPPRSIWEVFEHMRLAQEDILRYTLDKEWVSPPFPQGYWPANPAEMTAENWHDAVTKFFRDLDEVIRLAEDTSIDLTAEIPHGEGGHTYLREILLVADHNAYHMSEIVQIRRALGKWPKS